MERTEGIKRLYIDETTAGIVRELYQQYEAGRNLKELADWLFESKIHRPKDYRRYGHARMEEGEKLLEWDISSIRVILTNPVYMGHLVQARTCGKDYKLRRKHDIASEDWSIMENTHEAIISEEQFFKIGERFEKQANSYSNQDGFSKTVPLEEDIFKDILFCGECGRRMTRSNVVKTFRSGDRKRAYIYYCYNARRIDEFICERKSITKNRLVELVMAAIKQQFDISNINQKQVIGMNCQIAAERKKKYEMELADNHKLIENLQIASSELYLKYRTGELVKESFLRAKKENEQKIDDLNARKEQLTQILKKADAVTAERNVFLRALVKCDKRAEWNRELLNTLIGRIDVYPDKRLIITFRYKADDFDKVLGGDSDGE